MQLILDRFLARYGESVILKTINRKEDPPPLLKKTTIDNSFRKNLNGMKRKCLVDYGSVNAFFVYYATTLPNSI